MLRRGHEFTTGYRLQEYLGRGQFGEVWRASGPGGYSIAVKFVSLEDGRGRKEFEAIKQIKSIRHANLMQIIAVWQLDREGKLIEDVSAELDQTVSLPDVVSRGQSGFQAKPTPEPSQLIVGMTLGDASLEKFLPKDKNSPQGRIVLPADELLIYMEGTARGLDFLNSPVHDLGEGPVSLQHCDVKPANIVVVGNSAVLCDFGLARILSGNQIVVTNPSGTPAYMSPESIESSPSRTSDQYSLAVTYYHLRTGVLPVDDKSVHSVLQAHVSNNLDFSCVSKDEESVLRYATNKDWRKRFETNSHFVAALRDVLKRPGIDAAGSSRTPATRPKPRPFSEPTQPTVGGIEEFEEKDWVGGVIQNSKGSAPILPQTGSHLPMPHGVSDDSCDNVMPEQVPTSLSSPRYQAGQELVPGYTLVQLLGKGMEGEVWRAKGAGGTSVAIKVVRSLSMVGGRKQLKALRTLREIQHTNLCPLHCFWTMDESGRLLEEGAIDLDGNLSGVKEPKPKKHKEQPPREQDNVVDFSATMKVGPPGKIVDDETGDVDPSGLTDPLTETTTLGDRDESRLSNPTVRGPQPSPEQLILVMGLGDCTLHDRLVEVRRGEGLNPNNADDRKIACGLQPPEIIHYLRGAANAIDELNQTHNLFHCDIKPQNILVVGGGSQVCDFGLASKVSGDLTKTQSVMFATLAYAAPEVLRRKYSRSVDQYSLATTYFELRTGLLPFDVTTEADVTVAKCNGKLDFSKVTKAERKVLTKAMQVDPEARYESCAAFIDQIALATGVDTRPIPWRSIAAAACLLIAMTAAAVYSLAGGGDGGVSLQERMSEATQRLADFDAFDAKAADDPGATDNYVAKLEPLRDALRSLLKAWPQASESEQAQIRPQADDVATQFSIAITQQLAAGGLSNRDDVSKLSEDLDLLESVRDIERMLSSPPSLSRSIARSRLQISLLGKQAVSSQSIQSLRSINGSEPRVLDSVVLSLADRAALNLEGVLGSADAIETVAIAKKQIADQGSDALPEWCESSFANLQDELVPAMSEALDQKTVDPKVQRLIALHWPNLAADAKLNNIKRLVTKSDWKSFSDELQLAAGTSISDTPATASKMAVFERMSGAIEDPRNAASAMDDVAKMLQSDSVLKTYFLATIPDWLSGIAEQSATRKSPPSDIERTFQASVALMGKPESLPANFQTWLLATMLASETPPSESLRQFASSSARRGPSKATRLLGNIAEMESKTTDRHGQPIGKYDASVRDTIGLLNDPNVMAEVVKSIGESHWEHFEALAAFHAGDADAASQAWQRLQTNSANDSGGDVRVRFGSDRCRLVGMMLNSHLTTLSGVADDRVLEQRFVDAKPDDRTTLAKLLEHATWWTNNLPPNDTLRQDLSVQTLLMNLADVDPKSVSKPSLPSIDPNLRERLKSDIASGKAVAGHAQLYRGVFEVAKARGFPQMVDTAVAAWDVGVRTDQILEPEWIREIMLPAMTFIESAPARIQSAPSTVRFCESFLRLDGSVAARRFKEQDQAIDQIASQLDWLQKLETAATIVGRSGAEPSKQLDAWLRAYEFAQQRRDLTEDERTSDVMSNLEQYVSQAEATGLADPQTSVNRAFVNFQKALLQSDVGKIRQQLASAERSLATAIDDLQSSGGERASLYNAYWRHANSLVSLGFYESDLAEKKAMLLKARDSAIKAKQLMQSFDETEGISRHKAFLVLGNCCEDLAHYCQWSDRRKRDQYFAESITAFNEAIDATSFGNSLVPRYYLARCQFRYYKNGGDVRLDDVLKQMGTLDDDASASAKIEWLSWRAKISLETNRDDKQAAVDDLSQAYRVIVDGGDTPMDKQLRSETIWLYADVLAQTNRADQQEKALRILNENLSSIVGSTYWKAWETKASLMMLLDRADDLIDDLKAISSTQIRSDVATQPDATTESILAISERVRFACHPLRGAEPTYRDDAAITLRRIVSDIEQARHLSDSAVASAYTELIQANTESLHLGAVDEVVRVYLRALAQAHQTPGCNQQLIFQSQFALIAQFTRFLNENIRNRDHVKETCQRVSQQDREMLRTELASIRRSEFDIPAWSTTTISFIENSLPNIEPSP